MSRSFLDETDDIVARSLRGVVRLQPHLALDPVEKVVFLSSLQDALPSNKTILLSGGGSGHEPAHCGYVGHGMLDVAVCGNIFASPSASQITKALRAFPSSKGTLVIIKNYTGDALSFGLAIEKAKTSGINCKILIVGDDVSVPREKSKKVGRRGLAGTVFVHKIAGAAAERGADLETVSAIGSSVVQNIVTIGVSLDHCHVPGRRAIAVSKDDDCGAGDLEYGMGIHNEPGAYKASLNSLEKIISELLKPLLDMRDSTRSFVELEKGEKVAILLNNLGGVSVLDLQAILDEILRQMESTYDITPVRVFMGTFVSSLNGAGFSLTLLKLEGEMLDLLDQPTEAHAWNSEIVKSDLKPKFQTLATKEEAPELSVIGLPAQVLSDILREISTGILRDEPLITHVDTIAGDGDCGETLLGGCKALASQTALVHALSLGEIDTTNLVAALSTISRVIEGSMGGTSGAIYSIYLNSLTRSLDSRGKKLGEALSVTANPQIIAAASLQALSELFNYTQARVGDRTLMDVLIPFVDKLVQDPTSLGAAVAAAQDGAEGTKRMKASFGRASYVNEEVFVTGFTELDGNHNEDKGIPDAGALGLLSILKSVYKVLGD